MAGRRRKRLRPPRPEAPPPKEAPRARSGAGMGLSRRQLLIFAAVMIALIPLEFIIMDKVFTGEPGQAIEEVESTILESPSSPHLPYSSIPPTSGARTERGVPWGVHEEPIPNEAQVANLWEGGVIVQYNCPLGSAECDELVENLRRIQSDYQDRKVIVAPGPAIADAKVALSAWGRLEKLKSYREEPIRKFIEAFEGKGSGD